MRNLWMAIASIVLLGGCALNLAPAPRSGHQHSDGQPDNGRTDTWLETRSSGDGTVTVLYVPADGFAYRDPEGRLTGVTIEVMRAFARWVETTHDVQLTLDFVEEPSWQTFYGRVRDARGGVFGVGNVTITEPRRQELRFSPPYLTNVAVLITHEDVPELTTMEDATARFRGLHALAFEGTLHETRLRALRDAHLPDAEIRFATSNQEILDVVEEGGHFAYIDAYNYWRARDLGAPLRHHPPGDDPAEEFGVIMPLNTDWGPVIDAFFSAEGDLRDAGWYRAVLVRHLGEPLTRVLEDARAESRAREQGGE